MVKIFFFLRKGAAWAIALVITLFYSYHPPLALAGTNPNLFRNLFKAGHCCRYLSVTLLYNTLVLKTRPILTPPGVVWLDLKNCNFGTIPEKLNGLSDCTHLCKLIPLIMIMQCFLLIWTCAQWMYSEGVITTWQLPPRLTQSTAGTTLTCNRVALLIIVILKCFQTRPKINCAKV